MLTVLGIDVSPGLLERWVDWLAPDEQPFFLTKKQAAEITLGDGWMLHKPSQSWMSPRKVRTVGEVKRSTRTAGWRLQRRSVGL